MEQNVFVALAHVLVDHIASSALVRRYNATQHQPNATKSEAQTAVLETTVFNDLAKKGVENNGEMVLLPMGNFMDRAWAPILYRRPSKPVKTSETKYRGPS